MPKNTEGDHKPEADPPGEHPRMSKSTSSSQNSSSPIKDLSESPSTNGEGSEPTLSVQEEALFSSSTLATEQGYESPKSDPEREQEFSLTLHISTYGKNEQVRKHAIGLLKHAEVIGSSIICAYLNGKPLERQENDPKQLWD